MTLNKLIILTSIVSFSIVSLFISHDLLDTHISALGFALLFLIPNQIFAGLNTLGIMWLMRNVTSKKIKVLVAFLFLLLINLFVILSAQYIILIIAIIPILLGTIITLFYSEQNKFNIGAWVAITLNSLWVFLYFYFNI